MAIRNLSLMRFDPNDAILEAHLPCLVERADPAQPQRAGPGRKLEREHRAQLVVPAVGAKPEQDLQQQHRRACRPGLGPRCSRVRDRERRLGAREAGEDLRELVVEMRRRVEHPPDDPLRLRPARVSGEAPGDQRVVVGPDGAVVVRERVEAAVGCGHRPDAPARPEVRAYEPVDHRVDAIGWDDAAPEQVADVRAERVDLLLVAVEREHVEAAPLLVPERLVEARAELVRLTVQAFPELTLPPALTGKLGQAALRFVDVALNLDGRDRWGRQRSVGEALRVPRVLPGLVVQARLSALLVLDETVTIAV